MSKWHQSLKCVRIAFWHQNTAKSIHITPANIPVDAKSSWEFYRHIQSSLLHVQVNHIRTMERCGRNAIENELETDGGVVSSSIIICLNGVFIMFAMCCASFYCGLWFSSFSFIIPCVGFAEQQHKNKLTPR